MPVHLPTLLYTCIAALVLSAGLMTLFGSKLRTYRGFWYWTTAQWLLALGLLLQTQHHAQPWLMPVSTLLLLQSPITVLMGLRRFYSRHGLDVPVFADALVLALACMVWLATWAGMSHEIHWVNAFSAGTMVLHFYAAALLSRLREFKSSVALQTLAIIEVAVASLEGLRLAYTITAGGGTGQPDDVLLASSLLVVIPGLVMVYLGPLMSWERTEQALRAKHRKLRFLADMDVLTRVPNRRHFHELAASAVAACRPGGTVVMMLDIDHFKHINDHHGHASGDEALQQVAHCVRKSLREQDVAGRLGGDEFSLVLPDTEANDAINLAGTHRCPAGRQAGRIPPYPGVSELWHRADERQRVDGRSLAPRRPGALRSQAPGPQPRRGGHRRGRRTGLHRKPAAGIGRPDLQPLVVGTGAQRLRRSTGQPAWWQAASNCGSSGSTATGCPTSRSSGRSLIESL